ncbi:hypothetical protein BV898_05276 [Hypsibius exemplaris]|uniref:Uncharacterized protein n=1 Tax=Hypsibius exemplaris TaxID=2072580 RepID=A0A1W0WZR5_HYPEX|nr:hypothetical protein BV898_05276 [Hypsibius exemplaris]
MTTDMWTEDYNKTAFMSLAYHYRQGITQKKQLLFCAEYDVSKKKGQSWKTGHRASYVCMSPYKHRTDQLLNTKNKSEFKVPPAAILMVKLIEECKKLVTHSKQTYIARLMFRKLVPACPTRWNTNMDMLNSIRKNYDQIETILRDLDEVHFLPGPKTLLEEFAEFLKPFKDATVVLSADTSPTLHLVALYYYKLRRHANTFLVTTSAALRALVDHAKKVVPAKLVVDDIYKVAIFLYLASKHLPVFEDHEKPAIRAMVGARLAKLLKKLDVPVSDAVRVEKLSSFNADELLVYGKDTAETEFDDVPETSSPVVRQKSVADLGGL